MVQSLYTILGVLPTDTLQTIKLAYRRLVKLHHPDHNPSNSVNVSTFHQITAAYTILSDPAKRQLYDMEEIKKINKDFYYDQAANSFKTNKQKSQKEQYGFTAEEIFESILRHNNDFSKTNQKKSSNYGNKEITKNYIIKISFIESCLGVRKKIVHEGTSLEINIPIGIQDKEIITIDYDKKQNHNLLKEKVIIEILVANHPYWVRKGDDILMDIPITLYEYAQGVTLEIPSIHGKIPISIQPYVKSETIIKFKEMGIKKLNEVAGNMLVTIKIILPNNFNKDTLEALLKFEKDYPQNPRYLFN